MAAAPPYPHAPIAEAIIEIGVRPADRVGLPELEALRDGLSVNYPTTGSAGENLFQFEGGPRPSATAGARQTGFVLKDARGRQIVGLRYDRFTFSRLHPYDRWETFRDEARRLWDLYRTALTPPEVTDLSLRYINQFDLPGDGRLSTYLTIYPQVPGWATAAATGAALAVGAGAGGEVFMQVRLPRPALSATLTVTEATAPPLHGGESSVILDLHLQRDRQRDREAPQDETELWDLLEGFRDCKNEAFESFVTDRARELFQ